LNFVGLFGVSNGNGATTALSSPTSNIFLRRGAWFLLDRHTSLEPTGGACGKIVGLQAVSSDKPPQRENGRGVQNNIKPPKAKTKI